MPVRTSHNSLGSRYGAQGRPLVSVSQTVHTWFAHLTHLKKCHLLIAAGDLLSNCRGGMFCIFLDPNALIAWGIIPVAQCPELKRDWST